MLVSGQSKGRRIIIAMIAALMALWPALAAAPAAAVAPGAVMAMADGGGADGCASCPGQEAGQDACAMACLSAIPWAVTPDPATGDLESEGTAPALKLTALAGKISAPEPAPPRERIAR